MNRRTALQTLAAASAGLATASAQKVALPPVDLQDSNRPRKNRIKQSVVPWCFKPMPVEELIKASATLGLASVELVDVKHWPLIKELGMNIAIAGSHGFAKGFAQKDQWAECHKILRERIEQCAAAGVERVITFSGFRKGLSDEEGIANTVAGLKEIVGFAEEKKVTLCLEMLNSRVPTEMKGHPDYFCDSMERSVEICKQVGSERCKVLFDFYHVQIMHGDVIARTKEHKDYIAHIHTAGVPGRNEIDASQELNYPILMKTLLEIGYTGYVGQEFIPTGADKIAALADAIRICDV